MEELTLNIKKHSQEGNLKNEYNAFFNKLNSDDKIEEFDTDELKIDLNNPLNIECQPSYDGTVNLIINDDKNPPRIINSRFTKLEDSKYKIINRNQRDQTNLYKVGKIDQQTRLFRNINKIPLVDLLNVHSSGKLKGGNYTFYFKFADNDFNKTDIIAESGVVSIFKGSEPESISGTLVDEETDKSIELQLSNIDLSFSSIYVYFTRDYSDINGVRVTTAYSISAPYEIVDNTQSINITGHENISEISIEELNLDYHYIEAAKTQAQVQNILFFGNTQSNNINIDLLQNISYYIKVTLQQSESIGYINPENYKNSENDPINNIEYYSPNNIYYKLGYWPEEIYRLGIVYIMVDDSLTPVFNLRGCEFFNLGDSNIDTTIIYDEEADNLPKNTFLQDSNLSNTFGVFKNPKVQIISNNSVKPLFYKMTIDKNILEKLKTLKIKGYFFVRQKRIPTILCQGLSVGVDQCSYIPMLYDNTERKYIAEGFLNSDRILNETFESHKLYTSNCQSSGLISLDVCVNKSLQSIFDGSKFSICDLHNADGELNHKGRHYWINGKSELNINKLNIFPKLYFVNSSTPMKYVNGYGFSTKCGLAEDASQFSFFDELDYRESNHRLLRGIYCPFIGTTEKLKDNEIYNIKIPNYNYNKIKEYFLIRAKDNSPFYSISNRYGLSDDQVTHDVFRGDCYSNTVTIRINRNFIDPLVPLNDIIIDPETWKNNYKGYSKMTSKKDKDNKSKAKGNFNDINIGDLNTVPLGMWITFKCLSNYNLGLRSIDTTNVSEYSLTGSPRSFYPLSMSVNSSWKIEDSWLLNDGYNATVNQKRNYSAIDVPYIKDVFDNRIMFSNVQVNDDFRNAYRVFQGMDYKDLDRQYGAIVKIISWGVNILCIFEHGIGVIPINEKALIQTSTSQSIHMYGAGVIQNQITLINPDFGSTWQESIIRTPIGVYGVDTYAKKIWRFSDKNGLEFISDMKIQKFLNDNIKLKEEDKYPIIALKNVKTHYNNYKGDVMFTFYNMDENKNWNICFNERMNKWITRYSWTPLYSENINNIFYSLDKKRAEILSIIYHNKHNKNGICVGDNADSEWKNIDSFYALPLKINNYDLAENKTWTINYIETSYIDANDNEIFIKVKEDCNKIASISGDTIEFEQYNSIENWYKTTYNINDDICIPIYFKIDLSVNLTDKSTENNLGKLTSQIGVIIKNTGNENFSKQQSKLLQNGFYVHGKAGIFDEIKYGNENLDDQILPTKWYNKQEPFEFEFVVNEDIGLHKIFDNLVIISNKVKPKEIEYQLTGDVYNFEKANMFKYVNYDKDSNLTQSFLNCNVTWDESVNTYLLNVKQPCMDIKDFGRRLGNIQYKEDIWYLVIDPIKYRESKKTEFYKIEVLNILDNLSKQYNTYKNYEGYEKLENTYKKGWKQLEKIIPDCLDLIKKNTPFNEIIKNNNKVLELMRNYKVQSTRLRDKYVKIKVKYSGTDPVIITALKTIITNSYA